MTDTHAAVVTDEMRNAALSTFYALPAASLAPPYHESMTEALTAALAHLPPPSAELVELRADFEEKLEQEGRHIELLHQYSEQIAALEASNKAMRDDAERFRWLVNGSSLAQQSVWLTVTSRADAWADADFIRSLIDSDRAASSPPRTEGE